MSDQKLTVVIGADVSGLTKGVNQAEQSLKKFQKSTANTGQSLTNISRIAQDAPFGFIAIQNNLDPLIQSFGQLKRESGGTGAALKALAGSLAGPAGLALGFSVVVSAVTSLIQKYGSLGNAFRELSGSLSEAEKFQQGYNKAVVEGIGNAGKEKAELTALISVAQNENLSREGRQQAIDKLKQSYPGYLSDLNLENVSSQQVADSIDRINRALILKAKIQGAEKFIADQEAKKFELLSKPLEENINFVDKLAAAINFGLGNKGAAATGLLSAAQNRLGSELGSVEKQAAMATDILQGYYNELANINGITNKAPIVPKVGKTTGGAVAVPIIPDPASVAQFQDVIDDQLNRQFSIQNKLQVPVNLSIDNVKKQFEEFAFIQKAIFDNKAWEAKLKQMEGFASTVAGNLSNLFLDIAANGGNAFKTIGETIKNLVKSLAAAVIKAAAFAAIMAIINPASAGKGGVGFVKGFMGALGLGGSAAPNFGGISGGGLSGEVVFRQSGSDLVGVLARTNSRVGRVG